MPMNEEVRKAVEAVGFNLRGIWEPLADVHAQWQTIRAELTRLTEIADSVDPLVVRLGEVTTELEKMRAIVAACATEVGAAVSPTCSEQFLADVPLEVRAVRRNAESKLEAANALLREAHPFVPITYSSTGQPQLHARIQVHLSEPRT